MRVYDVKDNSSGGIAAQPMAMQDLGEPALNLTWNREGNMIFAGCCDKSIKMWDLNGNRLANLGQHAEPVASVHWCETLNVLYSMSWDKTIAVWDGKQPNPVMSFTVERKVFS